MYTHTNAHTHTDILHVPPLSLNTFPFAHSFPSLDSHSIGCIACFLDGLYGTGMPPTRGLIGLTGAAGLGAAAAVGVPTMPMVRLPPSVATLERTAPAAPVL